MQRGAGGAAAAAASRLGTTARARVGSLISGAATFTARAPRSHSAADSHIADTPDPTPAPAAIHEQPASHMAVEASTAGVLGVAWGWLAHAVPAAAAGTVVWPSSLVMAHEWMSAEYGLHRFHALTLIAMVAALASAFVFSLLRGRTTKLVFSAVAGVLLMQLTFGALWVVVLCHAVTSFLLLRIMAPDNGLLRVSTNTRGLVVLVWSVAAVVAYSCVKVLVLELSPAEPLYARFELTLGGLMFATMKVSSLAFNLHDGTPAEVAACNEELASTKSARRRLLLQDRARRAVHHELTALEFAGYVLGVPTVVVGQPQGAAEFLAVCDGSQYSAEPANTPPASRWLVVGRKLLFAGALLAIHLWGFARYSLGVTIQQHHIDAARASVWGFLAHFGHVYLAGLFVRCMFYAVYYTTDAIAIAAGFGYMGRDSSGRPDWSGCNRMDILGVEFAPHVVILARSWNKTVHEWAKRTVHERTGRTVWSFAVVGLLHGVDPGKLIWCCSWVPVGACVRLLRWRIKPWFFNLDGSPRNRWSKLYTLSGYVVTQFYITYGIATYFMIDVETSIRAYSSFLYLGHILALGAIPLLLLCPVPAWAEPYKGSLAAVNSGANHTSVMPVDAYYTAKPGATSKAAAAVARTRAGAGSRPAGAAGAGGASGGSGEGGKPRKGGARQRRGQKARG